MIISRNIRFLGYILIVSGMMNCKLSISQNNINHIPNTSDNILQFSDENDNWNEFVMKFNSIGNTDKILKILHIGDSHIQGGFFSNHLRDLFAGINISAGRGMAFPYNLSKTNGADDIVFYSKTNWKWIKCNKDNLTKIGIAGYEILSSDSVIDISIKMKCSTSNRIRVYHNVLNDSALCNIKCVIKKEQVNDSVIFTEFDFDTFVDSVNFKFVRNESIARNFRLFLLSLENLSDDFIYNSLGINGITFERYHNEVDYLSWFKHIQPDCIIVSLGTNDAFSRRILPLKLKKTVEAIVDDIYEILPRAIVVLTSPNDHLNNGTIPNKEILVARNIIKDVAREKKCVFWDFYEIMGGTGSSLQWYKMGWMYKDLIHLSKDGYKEQARLFFNSFMKSIEQSTLSERVANQ